MYRSLTPPLYQSRHRISSALFSCFDFNSPHYKTNNRFVVSSTCNLSFSDATLDEHNRTDGAHCRTCIEILEYAHGATFKKHDHPWRATIDHADGWEGFETLEKWVAGSFAGHSAFFLKDEMGNLWVGGSGHENEKFLLYGEPNRSSSFSWSICYKELILQNHQQHRFPQCEITYLHRQYSNGWLI
ncbi:hypothetical protein P8452_52521 [Trifolium repens]|nr:hypothetical protein P8452_52521 [Trifolium repens]